MNGMQAINEEESMNFDEMEKLEFQNDLDGNNFMRSGPNGFSGQVTK